MVKELKQRASLRDLDRLFVIRNKVPLRGEDYEKLRSSMQNSAREANIGDPLPEALWDQVGERVTIRDGGKIYDFLSIEPERPDRPDPTGTRKVARLTKETAERLRELERLAVIGGRKALDNYVARANEELRRTIPSTPLRLTRGNLHSASRDSDGGSLALTFNFSAVPGSYSFPCGEIQLIVPANGTPYVRKAGYCFDEYTDVTWGTAVAAEAKRVPGTVNPAYPRLHVRDADRKQLANNRVIRGTQGYPGPVLPSLAETPSHLGMISLAKLAAGTHWLLVRGNSPTVLRLKLAAAGEIVEPWMQSRPDLSAKNLAAKVAVETKERRRNHPHRDSKSDQGNH